MTPHLFVLFGATGDLAAKKLFPALYRSFGDASGVRVLGVGRSDWDDAKIQDEAAGALVESGIEESDARAWADKTLTYARVEAYDELGPVFDRADEIEASGETEGNRAYYLALPPSTFPGTITALGEHEADNDRAPNEDGH